MFNHKESNECRESRMTITDSTIAAVRQMIHYMYTGTLPDDFDCNEDETAVLPLLAIAHKYQIKPLIEYNADLLDINCTVDNVLDRLKLAEFYKLKSLKSACAGLIWDNIDEEEMKQMPEWIELEKNWPELALYVQKYAGDGDEEDKGEGTEAGGSSGGP